LTETTIENGNSSAAAQQSSITTYIHPKDSNSNSIKMASDDEKSVGEEEEADVAAMLDLSKKKKKKKKKKEGSSSKQTEGASSGPTTTGTVPFDATEQQRMLEELDGDQEVGGIHDRKAEYTYDELLERVVDLLQANNPDLVEKKRTRIKPPQMQTISSRKCMWVNFQEICSMMQRDPQHVYQFFMTELGTEGSIDGNQRLIIRKLLVCLLVQNTLYC
jgi:translation initiation factor 2 subunit 2